jgi:alkylation response protein AidB-like acyl-CoA dehydrogenase
MLTPPAPAVPAGDRYTVAARELAPLIVKSRRDIEQNRRLPSSLVEAMGAAGLFALWLPRALNGPELGVAEFVQVIEEIARADGAAGWCVAIAAGYSRLAGYFPDSVARTIFGSGATVVAGTLNPTGRARPVPGGWNVTGRWAYASGIQHSNWVIGNCVIRDDDAPQVPDGAPDIRLMIFPSSAAELIDTWHVSGLKGSGSHDFRVADLFVAHDHSICGFDAAPNQPGLLYAIPFLSALAVNVAAVSLGIARAAIDALVELADKKVSQRSTTALRHSSTTQSDVARAEALLRSARAFLFESIDEIWQEVEAGTPPTMRRRALVRLACAHVAATSAQAVDLMYNAGGGTSLYEDCPLERCFRDAHAITQHMAVSTINYELSGRVLLGLDPGTARF